MDKVSFLNQAKKLIADAETGQAIELTENFLRSDRKYAKLFKEAIRISAKHSKTERDERNGLVNSEQANVNFAKINDSLLHLLEYIENDNLAPAELRPTLGSVYRSNKWLFLAGLPTLVLSIVILVLVFQKKENPTELPPPVDVPEASCVEFEASAFPKIVVLPFFHPTGDDLSAHGLIVERLEDFSARFELNSDVELCRDFEPEKLLNYEEAKSFGQNNLADLIIWGRAEKSENDIVVKTRFRYLGERDTLSFTNLKWQGETRVDSVKVLSIITSSGELTSKVEATILLILGLVADQAGEYEKARMVLEEADVQDSTGVLIKNMMLAEYLQKDGDVEAAIEAYDKLLSVHPNYWLAENNRGVLRASREDYLGAIEDFSKVLEKRTKDAETYLARGMAYIKSEQLIPAVQDLENVLELEPEKKGVRTELEAIKTEVAELQKKVKKVKTSTPSQNLDQKKVNEVADANRRLGQNQEAKKWVSKGLELNPKSAGNIAISIELKLREGKKEDAETEFSQALKSGVAKQDIFEHSRLVKKYFEKIHGQQ